MNSLFFVFVFDSMAKYTVGSEGRKISFIHWFKKEAEIQMVGIDKK